MRDGPLFRNGELREYLDGILRTAVVGHLAARGWSIRRVADTSSRERGVDIEATLGGKRLLVEVKGYPSATYVRGPKEGTPKVGSAPLQARAYFGGALLSGVLVRAEHPEARVALAFPQVETYSMLCARTHEPLLRARVELWLVSRDGGVAAVEGDAAPS